MRWFPLLVLAMVPLVVAQDIPNANAPKKITTAPARQIVSGHFEFEIVESYDAKYLGDTPGHIGRHGELGDFRPHAALGDPVYRGDEKVGHVTGLKWSKGAGSLEIEVNPEPFVHICVGDVMWLKLGDERKP